MTNNRQQHLQQWLATHWPVTPANSRSAPAAAVLAQPPQLEPVSGDAGFRRYFRLRHADGSASGWLAVDAPPEHEANEAFVAIARNLQQQGVATPTVQAADFEQGFLLLEDFGEQLLFHFLQADPERGTELYSEVLLTLLRLQQCPVVTMPAATGEGFFTLPDYDQSRLRQELNLFDEWFVPQLLGHSLDSDERALLDKLYGQLEISALQQPQVWVHRDFHSRNLVHRAGQVPGVIDFQDAVRGPITYDLVSLLRDCYLRWPPEQVRQWALVYGDMAMSAGLMAPVSQEDFLRWFDWMGLQRHLKVLGIFARLWLRDGKAGYLQDLPLVLRYTLEITAAYPEFAAVDRWLRETVLPLCERQDWYRDYRRAGEADALRSAQSEASPL